MLKRIALTLALVAIISTPAVAQDFQHKSWYAQAIVGLPMGNYGDFANFGLGAGAGIHVPHSAEWSFRGEASYIYFFTDDFADYNTSSYIIPITALAQYDVKDSGFYGVGGVSLAFVNVSFEYPVEDNPIVGDLSTSDTSTEFGLVVGAGYNFSPSVDFGLRFNIISDSNYLSGHATWKF